MIELLDYSYMQRALVSAVLIGGLCSVVGVYVVLRGLSFIGAGIAHASFAGVAIGIALGVSPVWAAVIFCVLVAWGIGFVTRKGQVKEDTAVGIFFASSMALGVLIIGLMSSYQVDLFGYLFGSIISVTRQDLWTTVAVSTAVLGCVVYLFKDLMYIIFDFESAEVGGLPAERLYFLLLTIMALTVVVSIKVIGIILVQALLVIPAASAYQLTESFRTMMAMSVLFGVGSCVVGLAIAAWLEVAPGAAIVVLATVIFVLCMAISPRRRREQARAAGAAGGRA